MILFLFLLLFYFNTNAMDLDNRKKYLQSLIETDQEFYTSDQFFSLQSENKKGNAAFHQNNSNNLNDPLETENSNCFSYDESLLNFNNHSDESQNIFTMLEEKIPHPLEENSDQVELPLAPAQRNQKTTEEVTFDSKIHTTKIGSSKNHYYECQIFDCGERSETHIHASNHFKTKHLAPDRQVLDLSILESNLDINCNFPGCDAKVKYHKLNIHKMTHVTRESYCPYPNCKEQFQSRISTHITRSHDNFLYQCVACNKIETTKSGLNRHHKTHNSATCPHCQKELKIENLIHHLRNIHALSDEEAKRDQKIVRDQVNSDTAMNKLLQKHNPQFYKAHDLINCPDCQKELKLNSLPQHLERIHGLSYSKAKREKQKILDRVDSK